MQTRREIRLSNSKTNSELTNQRVDRNTVDQPGPSRLLPENPGVQPRLTRATAKKQETARVQQRGTETPHANFSQAKKAMANTGNFNLKHGARMVKKAEWDSSKDDVLRSLVQPLQGKINWVSHVGPEFRKLTNTVYSDEQLRTRWSRHLKPQPISKPTKTSDNTLNSGKKKGGALSQWTPEQEITLSSLVQAEAGLKRWRHITMLLNETCRTNYTPDHVKTHYQSMTKRRDFKPLQSAALDAKQEKSTSEHLSGEQELEPATEAEDSLLNRTFEISKEDDSFNITTIGNSSDLFVWKTPEKAAPEQPSTAETDVKEHIVEENDMETKQKIEKTKATWKPCAIENAFWEKNEECKNMFYKVLEQSKFCFTRKPIRRIPDTIPKEFLVAFSELIGKEYENKPEITSKWGWLNALVYSASRAVEFGLKKKNQNSARAKKEAEWYNEKEKYIKSLDEMFELIEKEVERRKENPKCLPSKEAKEGLKKIFKAVRGHDTTNLQRYAEILKQRKQVVVKRIEQRKMDNQRKLSRLLFKKSPSLKQMERASSSRKQEEDQLQETPTYEYWNAIIGTKNDTEHKKNPYLKEWAKEAAASYPLGAMPPPEQIANDCAVYLKKVAGWKAPGTDGVHSYWWKALSAPRNILSDLINETIQNGYSLPDWVPQGRTVLIFKKGDRKNPENYRPITCLNTMYKILTGVLNKILLRHLEMGPGIPLEQRALRKGEWGCLHTSLIDRQIIIDARSQKRRNVHVAWLDFRKAFDSVPHDYLLWILEKIQVCPLLISLLSKLMRNWRTTFQLPGSGKATQKMKVRNGIFQGDALSPTLFVIAVSTVSHALCQKGPKVGTAKSDFPNHLFYVDDLKLYANSETELNRLLEITSSVVKDIGLAVNTTKCARTAYKPFEEQTEGQKPEATDMQFPELRDSDTYKYLGINQRLQTTFDDYHTVREAVIKKTVQILQTNYTVGQKRSACNTIAAAKMRYYYQLTHGGAAKLESCLHLAKELDKAIRKILVKEKVILKNSCVDRLYLDTTAGGLGWTSFYDELENAIVGTWAYLKTKPELQRMVTFFSAEQKRGKRNPLSDGQKIIEKYNIAVNADETNCVKIGEESFRNPSDFHRFLIKQMKQRRAEDRLAGWKGKVMAGAVARSDQIDTYHSYTWIRKGYLSSDNARNAISAQEGSLIVKAGPQSQLEGNQRLCRWCKSSLETVNHVLNNCKYWLTSLYIARHDSAARVLHYWYCKKFGFTPPHYSQPIPTVMKNSEVELYWNHPWQTAKILDHNKPDLVVFYKKLRKAIVYEFAITTLAGLENQKQIKLNRYTVNSFKQEDETKTPYPAAANLIAELRETLIAEVDFVPIIIGTSGEHMKDTAEMLKEATEMKKFEIQSTLERMSRTVAINSSRIIKNHFSKA